MENIIKLETIQDYNNLLGTKTLHPLVSVADLSTLNGTPLDRLYNRNAVGNDKKIQKYVVKRLSLWYLNESGENQYFMRRRRGKSPFVENCLSRNT